MKGRVWFFPHSNIESGVFALRPILEWRVLAGLGFTRWENWSKKFDNICGPWKQNNFRPAAEFRFPGVKPELRGLPTSCLCRRHTREGGAGGEKIVSFWGSTYIDGLCTTVITVLKMHKIKHAGRTFVPEMASANSEMLARNALRRDL